MAITWTSRPARDEGDANWALRRCPRSGTLRGVILTRRLTGTGTHYFHGRTTPCMGVRCEPCKDGLAPRWYGYLGLWSPSSDRLAIAEITDGCADEIDRYFARHSTLRGAILTLRRQGARPNGRVLADVTAGQIDESRLPPEPDIVKALERIWGLTATATLPGTLTAARQQQPERPAKEQATNGHSRNPI